MSSTDDKTMWMWEQTTDSWIQVFQRHDYGPWSPVDARMGDKRIKGNRQFSEKPEWTPSGPVGVIPTVKMRRVLQYTEDLDYSSYDERRAWGEIDEVDNVSVASVEITEVSGFEHTHRCSWCEETVATDPGAHDLCSGCGAIDAWEPWNEEALPLGPVTMPDCYKPDDRRW